MILDRKLIPVNENNVECIKILSIINASNNRQRIHLKHQALFFSKDKSKKLKCRLLQFLVGALRVNICLRFPQQCKSIKKL